MGKIKKKIEKSDESKKSDEIKQHKWEAKTTLPSTGEDIKITFISGEDQVEKKAKMLVGYQKDKGLRRFIRRKEEEIATLKEKGHYSSYKNVEEELKDLKEHLRQTENVKPIPVYRNIRDAQGNFVTYPLTVQGVRIQIKFADKERLQARSCCKPPDIFTNAEGTKIALKRLFRMDKGINPSTNKVEDKSRFESPRLSDEDRLFITRMIRNKGRVKEAKELRVNM